MISQYQFYEIKLMTDRLRMSAEQIAKCLNMSPTTVREWRRREKWEPRKGAQRECKIDPFKPVIDEALRQFPDYSARQLFQMILNEGYEGGETQVKKYVRSVRPRHKEAYLELNFPPGQAAQVDWGIYGTVNINGTQRKLSFFVMTLCWSRMNYVEFTLGEAQEHWHQCHVNAFEYFGGIPRRIIVDNCKTAVIRWENNKAILNSEYAAFAAYHGFEIRACRIRRPTDKGRVENAVKYVKGNFLKGRKCDPYAALQPAVLDWLAKTANPRVHATTKEVPLERFEQTEKTLLQSIPLLPYDCCRWEVKKVSRFFMITYDTNRYSVPSEYVGETVKVRITPDHVSIYHGDKRIAEHPRSYAKGAKLMKEEHERELLTQRKRARSRGHLQQFLRLASRAAEFYEGLQLRRLKSDIHVRKILALSQVYGDDMTSQAISDACDMEVFGSDYIQNMLECRARHLPKPGPLHITHKRDMLDLQIDQPDMSIYDQNKESKQ
jgi:transposase